MHYAHTHPCNGGKKALSLSLSRSISLSLSPLPPRASSVPPHTHGWVVTHQCVAECCSVLIPLAHQSHLNRPSALLCVAACCRASISPLAYQSCRHPPTHPIYINTLGFERYLAIHMYIYTSQRIPGWRTSKKL